MKDFREQNFYELLDVLPHSTPQELEKSYQRARRFFSPDSVATYALFQPDELNLLRRRIEEAFRTLNDPVERKTYDLELTRLDGKCKVEELQPQDPAPEAGPSPEETMAPEFPSPVPAQTAPPEPASPSMPQITDETEITGELLKQARLARGMTLDDYVQVTKISIYYLRNIEDEDFSDLPASVYVRGYLRQMATLLGLDAQRVSTDYIERMERIRGEEEKQFP